MSRTMRDAFESTVHELNRRYARQCERVRELQDELDNIKNSRAYRLLCMWRRWSRPWKSHPATPGQPISFASEIIDPDGDAGADSAGATVSAIIPFKDRHELLRNCLESMWRCECSPDQIILVDNGSTCAQTRAYLDTLRARPGVELLDEPGDFNFARLCNRAAAQATAGYLLFLNNDVEAISDDWLQQLIRPALQPDVGVTGATLLYPDRTIQHAGIFPRSDDTWFHAHRGTPLSPTGDTGALAKAHTVPAVSGACLLIHRDRFEELGGFDERFPLDFNDVDLCCRARQRGWKVALSPARLIHFESLSRGYERDAQVYRQQ